MTLENAERIFGPDVGSLKGKIDRRAGPPVQIEVTDLVPDDIFTEYKNVTLSADIMIIYRKSVLYDNFSIPP